MKPDGIDEATDELVSQAQRAPVAIRARLCGNG